MPAVDPEAIRVVTAQLDTSLACGDTAACELLEQHIALLRAAFPKYLDRIDKAINAFDFEAALTLLREAVTTFK